MSSLTRRGLLNTLAALPLTGAVSAAEKESRQPKASVSGLEVFHVKVNKRGNWTIVRLQSDVGVSGIGDASQSGNVSAGVTDDTTLGFLKQFHELLKGRSIYDIEWFREQTRAAVLQHGSAASVAASSLEHCLWDIRGKLLWLPVYELLGGALKTKVRQYANINRSTDPRDPESFGRMAENAVKAGFTAVKLAPFDEISPGLKDPTQFEELTKRGLECAAAVRQAIGPQRDLLIDAHSRFDLERGVHLLDRIEPLNLFWLEEVTPAKPLTDLAAINELARMPTAGGETLYAVEGFYPYVEAKAVDIVMPDVKVCGGVWELKKIAALAEGAGQLVSPHGPASPVGNMIAAHVSGTASNFLILEFSYGEVPWRAELIEPAEDIVGSHLALPDKPGYGITLNQKAAAKYAI